MNAQETHQKEPVFRNRKRKSFPLQRSRSFSRRSPPVIRSPSFPKKSPPRHLSPTFSIKLEKAESGLVVSYNIKFEAHLGFYRYSRAPPSTGKIIVYGRQVVNGQAYWCYKVNSKPKATEEGTMETCQAKMGWFPSGQIGIENADTLRVITNGFEEDWTLTFPNRKERQQYSQLNFRPVAESPRFRKITK